MINKTKKIMVCDTNRSYFNFLKKEFSEYEFIYYNEKTPIINCDFVIFFKNKTLECLDFLKNNNISTPIIVAVYDDLGVYLKTELWENGVVHFLKTSTSKIEIKNKLKAYFETISF